jgi:hypothetical protein
MLGQKSAACCDIAAVRPMVKSYPEKLLVPMEYPELLLTIRRSGRRQYDIAQAARIRESRVSQILRRGGARAAERARLSAVLGRPEAVLFATQPCADDDSSHSR